MTHFFISLFLIVVTFFPVTRGNAAGLDLNTSISQNYFARNILSNPAALGYNQALNGFGFYYAHTQGFQKNLEGERATTLAIGPAAFALERLVEPTGTLSRASLGAGFSITPDIFFGGRYRWTSSDVAQLGGLHLWDFGVQYRPSQQWSLGLLLQNVTSQTDLQYGFSATYRPIENLDLSFDLFTPGQSFLKDQTSQVLAGFEPSKGFRLFAGYHTERKFLAGVQIQLGVLSLFSQGYAGSNATAINAGLQLSHLPFRSSLHPDSSVEIALDKNLGEAPLNGGILGTDRPSLWQKLEQVKSACDKPEVRKLFVHIDSLPLGMAAAQDLNEAIRKCRSQDKIVIAYISQAGIKEYIVASAASQIVMEPTAELRFTGLKNSRYFFKGLFEKVGVEPQFLAKGEYKSAPESFLQKQTSPLVKKSALEELKVAEDVVIGTIAQGRTFDRSLWSKVESEALLSAKRAKELGLIDEIAHAKGHIEQAKKGLFAKKTLKTISEELSVPDKVAVIVINGNIMQDEIRLLSLTGESTATPKRLNQQLEKAARDPKIKSIVLRVSSPGGEVVASDQMASAIKLISEKKPVVVSMGDVAASGGYFVSAPAKAIVAQPLTLTGSIGVFLGKFSLKDLLNKVGLNKEILTHSPYPGLNSEDRPWTAAEQQIMQRRLNEYYSDFVEFVASHRKLSNADAEKAAKGRVVLGKEAKSLGLVDEVGSYQTAVTKAAVLGGIENTPYEVEVIASSNLLDLFGDSDPFLASEPSFVFPSLKRTLATYTLLGTERPLFWTPDALTE